MISIKKLRKYGIKGSIDVLLRYKLEPAVDKFFSKVFSRLDLQNLIILASHNDFDMNAGALYQDLLEKKFNKKFKIIWFVEKVRKIDLPENVYQVHIHGIHIKRYYWNSVAKYILYDDTAIRKYKRDQVVIYLGHATRAMKDCRGRVDISPDVDYVCSSSESNDELMADVYSCSISKMLHVGFPVTDLLYKKWDEIDKLGRNSNFKKIIIWMPTFRKSAYNTSRDDTSAETETGLSLIETFTQYHELNVRLIKEQTFLIIKLHPAQDVNMLHIKDTDNVLLLTPEKVKELGIDTYKLMTSTDALISDYSSVSFDYILLNKPIAYVLSDYDDYKLGFAVSNPKDYMPGEYLYNMDDMLCFIDDVTNGTDKYQDKRNRVKEEVALYNDGKACERIEKFLSLRE